MVPDTIDSSRGLGHILRTYQRSLRTLIINVSEANGDRIYTGVGKGEVQTEEIVTKSIGNALAKLSSKGKHKVKPKQVVGKGQEVNSHVERVGI